MATSDTVGAIASLSMGGTTTYFSGKILSLDVGKSVSSIERTPLDRTSGGMTFEVGRLTSWTMSGTMIYDPKHEKANAELGVKGAVVLTFADATGTTLTWSTGFLTELSSPIALEEGIEASFTIQLCGDAS